MKKVRYRPRQGDRQDRQEESKLPADGLHFEVPPGQVLDSGVRSALRRLHVNLRHPSAAELSRFLRQAGGSAESVAGVEWLRCSTCAKHSQPKSHRPSRMPPQNIQFGDEVVLDCFQIHDAGGDGHWFLSVVDRATSFHVGIRVPGHDPMSLWRAFYQSWVRWAGPPQMVTTDGERGFGAADFESRVSAMGALLRGTGGHTGKPGRC